MLWSPLPRFNDDSRRHLGALKSTLVVAAHEFRVANAIGARAGRVAAVAREVARVVTAVVVVLHGEEARVLVLRVEAGVDDGSGWRLLVVHVRVARTAKVVRSLARLRGAAVVVLVDAAVAARLAGGAPGLAA